MADDVDFARELERENMKLRQALNEAAQEIADWGSYASEYFQEKHDLAGTVERFRAIARGDK